MENIAGFTESKLCMVANSPIKLGFSIKGSLHRNLYHLTKNNE